MKTTTTKLIILFVVIFFSGKINANKLYNGYVNTLLGEVYTGKIKMQTPALNEVRVYFISIEGKKNIFKADEVKEYGFEVRKWDHKTRQHNIVNVIYVKKKVKRSPVAFGAKEVLLEREVQGRINLYHHFVEKNANIESPLEHIIYIEKINNQLIEVTKENYQSVLKKMTLECEVLQTRIGTKGNGFKKFTEMIEYYNEWIIENGEEDVLDLK